MYINIVERNKLKKKDEEAMMRKQSLKKAAALAISVMCMAGVFTGCGNNKSNTSSGDNANTDAKLTVYDLKDYLNAYQSKKTLSMDEIWSMKTFLQLALIENIRSVCKYYN